MDFHLQQYFHYLSQSTPDAYATMYGSASYPNIYGNVYFYSMQKGSLVCVTVNGLPYQSDICSSRFFGFHIHEGMSCKNTAESISKKEFFPFVSGHLNPNNCIHPQHVGDLPSLLGNNGYAFSVFYSNQFTPEMVVGHTIILHHMPDDFHSQPSGNSGEKIACGEIQVFSL